MVSWLVPALFSYAIPALVTLIVCLIIHEIPRLTRKGLPPGPYGLPVVGYLPFLGKDAHRDMDQLRKQYGNIFGMFLGSRFVVGLCDYPAVKEALSQDALLNRPKDIPFAMNKESQGLMVVNGPLWREQRRFSLRLFKNLGVTTQTMEQHIHDELQHLLVEFKKCEEKPVVATTYLTPSMSNIISALVFGKRFEYKDSERVYLDDLIETIPRLAAQMSAVNFFPWIRDLLLFFKVGSCEKLRHALACREDFVDSKITSHEETFEEGTVRDYIDGFLSEMKQDGSNPMFTRQVLKGNGASFFGAGSETVRTAIDWLLLVSAAYPNVQEKVQAEIAEVVGHDGQVSWSDSRRMPYTQAVIWELLRWKPINPLNLMRQAYSDVKVGDYIIPKGSIVIACLWSLFHDPEVAQDPEVFRPERHLTDNGRKFVKPEYLIPFSYGKRSCPGEVIAVMEIFIYFTTLLQHFCVTVPEGRTLNFNEVLGVSLRPEPQELIMRRR
ncbi:cytochrome P450 2J6-like [Ornithodoros turicata]